MSATWIKRFQQSALCLERAGMCCMSSTTHMQLTLCRGPRAPNTARPALRPSCCTRWPTLTGTRARLWLARCTWKPQRL
ncbi:unnamed protein product [Polarella glacialis]|uniref:Uncharacterized protein n=1 Tax=Polarella glacialis TaxID=89957 RepID=A0A813DCN9_POLGL|nr:unnamed protein product [Polarella glacialis]